MIEPLFCNLDDKLSVYRSVSDLFGVCTYFLVDKEKVIIVDPGLLDEETYLWLEQFENYKKTIYLTHEHFDHHYDVNKLSQIKNTSLYIFSDVFKKALFNSRKNLSYYYNTPVETVGEQTSDLSFFEVLQTPGHSKLSVCLLYKSMLFGGDTVISKENLVLKLPGSNRLDFKDSVTKIKKVINKNTVVLPGHGNLFCFDSWKI